MAVERQSSVSSARLVVAGCDRVVFILYYHSLCSLCSLCSPGSLDVSMAAPGLTDWLVITSPWEGFYRRVSARIYFQSLFSLIFIQLGGPASYIMILLCCIIIVYIVEKQTWFLSDFRPHTRVEKWIQWLVMLIKILFLKPDF